MNTFKNVSLAMLIGTSIVAGMSTNTTTTTTNIPWDVITSSAFPPVTSLKTNDSLTFDFAGEVHNVYQFPDKFAYNDCNFSNATEVSDSGPVTINVTEGVTYFGCSVGNHCKTHGMRVAVITI
jgi:hypothetical protein